MSQLLGLLVIGLASCGTLARAVGPDRERGTLPEETLPVGPLGDLLKRDDWKSVRLRLGSFEGGKVSYLEARMTSRRDIDRLRSILAKAKPIASPATYEMDREQAFDVELDRGPSPRVTLFAPPRRLAIGETGAATYYEISSKDLVELCRELRP